MGFNNIGGTVKLNNIKTFNNAGSKNNVFKTQFYDDVDKIDYATPYTEINYNEVNIDANEKDNGLTAQDVANLYAQSQMQQTQIEQEMYRQIACDAVNTFMGLAEGLMSFGEGIVDTGALIVGVGGTILTGITDIFVNGLIFGDWDFDATSSLWKDGIMPFVGTNYTDKTFSAIYETEFMQGIEADAHSVFKRDGGVVYEISKGVGYYTGMIALSTVTAGAATSITGVSQVGAISVNTISQGAVAAAGSFGKNSQNNYNASINNNVKEYYISEEIKKNGSLSYDDALKIVESNIANGVYKDYDVIRNNEQQNLSGGEILKGNTKALATAAIEGGTYFLAGAAGDTITTYNKALAEATKMGGNVSKYTESIIKFGAQHKDGITIGIKATKAYVQEGVNAVYEGRDYNLKAATIDAASTIIAENVFRGVKNSGVKLYKSDVKTPEPDLSKVVSKISDIPSINTAQTDTMAEFTNEVMDKTTKEVVSGTFKNIYEIGSAGIKKGIEKGEEKAIKSVAEGAFDNIVSMGSNILSNAA